MHDAGVDPQAAIRNPDILPFGGRTGETLRERIAGPSKGDLAAERSQAIESLERAEELSASILVHGDPAIWDGNGSVAVVGSRNVREPYAEGARTLATAAARLGMVVVSAFAAGADSMAHCATQQARGRTICVMPCGLDHVFLPRNRNLWQDLLDDPDAVFISESGFAQRVSPLRLRKRNRLFVAFAQGVVVAQSAVDGGAMSAYRAGREQRKPVATFRPDGYRETSGNTVIARDRRTGSMVLGWAEDPSRYEFWLRERSSRIRTEPYGPVARETRAPSRVCPARSERQQFPSVR